MAFPTKEHHHHGHGHVQSTQSQPSSSCLTRSLVTRVLYVLLPLLVLHLYFFSRRLQPPPPRPLLTHPSLNFRQPQRQHEQDQPPLQQQDREHDKEEGEEERTRAPVSASTTDSSSSQECNLIDGRWVQDDAAGYLYNDTTCGTIKEGQNCMAHGRPDTGYLRWRWQPTGCSLPAFDATLFLRILRNKHLVFIGDSLARNQLESLLCLLSTAATPDLVYRNGEDNKFRRWRFPPPYNASVSIYWSPFLVKGREKDESKGLNYNILYLDTVDDRWATEIDGMDLIVFAIGHWFLHPAVYLDNNGSSSLGCHFCAGMNHTEVGFYDVFRKALDTSLDYVIDGGAQEEKKKNKHVTVTTFSPSHFVGEWDKAGACPKKEPEGGDVVVEGMNAEMRRRQVEAFDAVIKKKKKMTMKKRSVKLATLDVTRLALLRPDGHPGPYMLPFPFAHGIPERVQNDCVHWCLPGPIDTWNQIYLEMVKIWWKKTKHQNFLS